MASVKKLKGNSFIRLILGFTPLGEPLGSPTNRIVLLYIPYLLKKEQNIVKLYYVFKIKR